jgi:ferredoxin
MRLSVDEAVCTGHGLCYAHAPELFDDDDHGYGHVIGAGTVPEELRDGAREAVGTCPEGAISLDD